MEMINFEFDYTFATRLKSFAESISANCAGGEDEREYFISVATRLLKHQTDNATEQAEIEYLKRCHDVVKSDTNPQYTPVIDIIEAETPINIYLGELNVHRIEAIDKTAELYSITKSTVREVFCKGADWALGIGRPETEVRRTLKKGQK